jgi:hypothetical protein
LIASSMLVGAFAVTNFASHPATTIMAASYSHCRCHHGGKVEDYRRIQKIRLALISFDDSAICCKTREITHDLNIANVVLEPAVVGEFFVIQTNGADFDVIGKIRMNDQ